MLVPKLVNPFKFENEEDPTIFLVLSVVNPDNKDTDKFWQTVVGRQAVFDEIEEKFRSYGYYNFFKSNIFSYKLRKTPDGKEEWSWSKFPISAYSFIRSFIGREDFDTSSMSILTLDDFHILLCNESTLAKDVEDMGIESDDDFTEYYKHDMMNEVWKKNPNDNET